VLQAFAVTAAAAAVLTAATAAAAITATTAVTAAYFVAVTSAAETLELKFNLSTITSTNQLPIRLIYPPKISQEIKNRSK
jgi:hypothetical protein